MEIIYAKSVACEIQNIRREFCCGCKVREQDCLMMNEHETWQMYRLNAIEVVNNGILENACTDTRTGGHGHTDIYGKDGQLLKRRTLMEKTDTYGKTDSKHLKPIVLSFKKEAHTVL